MIRPDSRTITNTGQRLILNREGLAGLVNQAEERANVADSPFDASYLDGVADVLDWLLGDEPSGELRTLIEIEP